MKTTEEQNKRIAEILQDSSMKNIEENNKLIAEFMGYEELRVAVSNHIHDKEPLKELKYHTSFDWLMPVVEKIEGLGYDTELVYRLDDGGHCFYINDSPIFSSQMGGKKEATYTVVIEFIKWYNKNK